MCLMWQPYQGTPGNMVRLLRGGLRMQVQVWAGLRGENPLREGIQVAVKASEARICR